jgi:hypothetical protein
MTIATSDITNASARVVIKHSMPEFKNYLIIKRARGNKDRRKQMQLNYLKS